MTPLFYLKSSFGWWGVKFFTFNHDLLLVWVYPENLRLIRVSWIFAWFGVLPPPFFCLKSSFGWGGGFFWPNLILSLAWGYPETLSKIRVGWIFAWFGGPSPFFWPKINFWLMGSKFFHSQSHSFLGLGLSWEFQPNPKWLNFCLIWGAPPHFFA